MSMYEIAITFWGSVGVFGIVLAILGGPLDAKWRRTRRQHSREVQSQASARAAFAGPGQSEGIGGDRLIKAA